MGSILINNRGSEAQLEQQRLQQVGRQIRALRKQQKMSQTELAERVGLSRRSISEIENGGNTSLAGFMRILHVFSLLSDFEQILRIESISPKAAFEAQAKHGFK